MATASLLLLALLLVLPSANYQGFDGLPLSSGPEFLVLVLLAPLVVGRGLRRLHRRWVASWPRAARGALVALGVFAVGVKLVLLATGSHEGFLACYGSPLEPPRVGPCERSFEHPFFRFGVTRLDRTVDFGENDWDLGFLNSVRFDRHYAGFAGRLRRRMPIEASWQGNVERAEPWVARIIYVGEVTLTVDPDGPPASRASTALTPRYAAPVVTYVPVPAGRHAFRIDYRFDDGSTSGGPPPDGPWATLRVERGRGTGGRAPGAPVTAVRPTWARRGAAAAGDAAISVLALTVLLFHARLLWRDAWLLALVAGAAPLVNRLDPARIGLPSGLGLYVLLGLVAVPLLGRRWRRRLIGAFFAMVYVAWFTTLHTFRRLDVVTLREWAGDPLFYESQARSILESWSLEGGEPVFIYQPLYRYVRFAQRLLLGEGDGLVSLLALAALWWALCWAVARLWPRSRPGWPRAILFGSTALLLLALASTAPVVFFIQVSLSEYPTWIFLALLFPMLFASQSPAQWRSGVVLASLSILTRSNQAAGVLALLGTFAWRTWKLRSRVALGALVLAAFLLALPAVHNLYYGGQLAMTGKSQPHLLRLPPQLWPRILGDPAALREALNQIDHLFYLNPVDDPPPRGDEPSRNAMRGLQVLWLATCVLAVRRWGFAPGAKLLLYTLPLAYLGVHFVFVVDDYYPRHVIVGHLAMGLVTLNAVGRGWPPNDR